MSISIQDTDLNYAAEQGIISFEQAQSLWPVLKQRYDDRWRMRWVHAGYLLGAVLIVLSMTWFTSLAWEDSSGLSLLGLTGLYVGGFGYSGYRIWTNPSGNIPQIVGGIFSVISVCISPMIAYSLQRFFNYWPPLTPGIFEELAAVITGTIVVWFVPFPPLTAPIALAVYSFSQVDLAHILFGPKPTLEENAWVSIVFGSFMCIFGYFVDRQKFKEDFAFWTYLLGATALWGGLDFLYLYPIYTSETFKLAFFIINLAMIGVSLLLNRNIFLLYGSLGATYYVGDFLYHHSSVMANSWMSILFGSLVTFSAYYTDQKNPKNSYSYWAYLAGVSIFWGGLATLYGYPVYSGWFFGLIFVVINISLMVAIVYVHQNVFLFWGTIGVFWYAADLASKYFDNPIILPIIITLLGLLLIAIAVYFSNHRSKARNQQYQLLELHPGDYSFHSLPLFYSSHSEE